MWLHWDHKTIRQRGRDALLNHRMDFLLLLPHGQRVVLEVDGMTHYAADNGRASSTRYAKNVRGDRELKLNGYEVYRFGATELHLPDASDSENRQRAVTVLQPFFKDLFQLFTVSAQTS